MKPQSSVSEVGRTTGGGPSQIAVYEKGQEWSEWFPFARSSTIAAARYKLDHSGTWQVIFGGKEKKPSKKNPGVEPGITGLSCYEYGPSQTTNEAAFWQWVNQYVSGGSAGIWFDLHVKRAGVSFDKKWTQGA